MISSAFGTQFFILVHLGIFETRLSLLYRMKQARVKRASTTIYGTGILCRTVKRTVFRAQAFVTEFVGFDEA